MTLEELQMLADWDQDDYEQCLLLLRDDTELADATAQQLMFDSEMPREDGIFDLITVFIFAAGWLEYFLKLDERVWERLQTAIKELPID